MIITLKGADFSASNIGTLSSWRISRSLGSGATYAGATSVDKGAAFSATVTLAEGYEIGTAGVTITMGGTVLSGAHSISGNVITITIAEVTGNVLIKVPTVNTAGGDEPDEPVIGINRITAHGYATAIPNGSTSETNLFDVIDYLDLTYNNTTGAYAKPTGTLANTNSISIPVVPGDRIVWTAIKAKGENGNTASDAVNGIRYTLFLDSKKVNSIAPADAYSDYAADGYIEIPDGVNCINVPVWDSGYDNECYLLTLSAEDTSRIGFSPIVGNRTTTNAHATALPDNITYSTNLIGTLEQIDNSYYTASGWSSEGVENISCITFPVLPGDKISSNVFGTTAESGNGGNGTRVTFLSGNTTVESRIPNDVYTEYSTHGYITVPNDCDCVSVPFTTSAVSTHKLFVHLLTI